LKFAIAFGGIMKLMCVRNNTRLRSTALHIEHILRILRTLIDSDAQGSAHTKMQIENRSGRIGNRLRLHKQWN